LRRLVLFDIDGTLLSASGVSGRAMGDALREVFGDAGPIDTYDFSGKTDPLIVRELMSAAGRGADEIERLRPRVLARYHELLAQRLRPEHVVEKPGAVALVQRLHEQRESLLALLTGNLEPCARLKLAPLRLNDLLAFGAFGSDHEDRSCLAGVAVDRARHASGRSFAGREVVVIGDSVHDVLCGRALGVKAIAVATGRTSRERLAEAGAHVVLEDLSATDAVIDAIFSD
jgi:phosphoglycolate phosphatase